MALVLTDKQGPVTIISINRPSVRNCVDRRTATALRVAFRDFENDATARVAVLAGEGGTFCAGADLKAVSSGDPRIMNDVSSSTGEDKAPMGLSRMAFKKPVIAAIDGYAVAGGLELAILCDLRVVEEDAVMGVFCRRWGVPLIDGGTVRLPRLVGLSRALDLILTGRPVDAKEALMMGLANRVVAKGKARAAAIDLAAQIAAFPQECMLGDRKSTYAQSSFSDIPSAMKNEFEIGLVSLAANAKEGAGRFAAGQGRHGMFEGTTSVSAKL